MRVILLQDIKKVGRKNEVKEVSDGYGRNFLIARGLAKAADASGLNEAAQKKESVNSELRKLESTLEAIKKEFKSAPLLIKVELGKHGEIFRSVTAEDIKKSLASKGYENIDIEPATIHLKTLGEHAVGINLGRGVRGEISLLLAS